MASQSQGLKWVKRDKQVISDDKPRETSKDSSRHVGFAETPTVISLPQGEGNAHDDKGIHDVFKSVIEKFFSLIDSCKAKVSFFALGNEQIGEESAGERTPPLTTLNSFRYIPKSEPIDMELWELEEMDEREDEFTEIQQDLQHLLDEQSNMNMIPDILLRVHGQFLIAPASVLFQQYCQFLKSIFYLFIFSSLRWY